MDVPVQSSPGLGIGTWFCSCAAALLCDIKLQRVVRFPIQSSIDLYILYKIIQDVGLILESNANELARQKINQEQAHILSDVKPWN